MQCDVKFSLTCYRDIYLSFLITEYPFFDNWNITTGTEGLNIHYSYGVPDTSPSVFEVQWTKDGKSLELTSPKYIGGELNDSCLTITSTTLEDKGNYLCKVANTVGTVSKNVLLGTVFDLKIDIF